MWVLISGTSCTWNPQIFRNLKTSINGWTNVVIWRTKGVEDERVDNKAASAAQCFLSFWPLFQLDRDPKFLAVVLMLTLQYIIPFDHGCTDSSSLTTSSSSVGTEGIVKVVQIFKYFFWYYLTPGKVQLLENRRNKLRTIYSMEITLSIVQSVLSLLWPHYSFDRL